MVAISGAIEEFDIDPSTLEPKISTIGGEKPKGICGSGLINIVAGLLLAGVIGQNGKFNTDLTTPQHQAGDRWLRICHLLGARNADWQGHRHHRGDIDNLIRAKAAMYRRLPDHGEERRITCHDFEQVIIAGAFGSHIDIEKAITIGLFPDLPREKFTFIGNGSLMGRD